MKKLKSNRGSVLSKIFIFIAILIVIGLFLGITNTISDISSVSEEVKTNIKNVTTEAGLDANKLELIRPGDNWIYGPTYNALYEGEFLYFYFYENGEIVKIMKKANTIWYNENATGINEKEENAIYLVVGELGEFGREDDWDGEKTIRYYIPEGKYNVEPVTKYTVFFVESIELVENSDGYSEPISTRRYEIKDSNETIDISSDECIFLALGKSIKLTKIE